MLHDDHNINNVCLTLINEGKLYGTHYAMARRSAMDHEWQRHVRNWQHLAFTDGTRLDADDTEEAATLLRDYYEAHIKE